MHLFQFPSHSYQSQLSISSKVVMSNATFIHHPNGELGLAVFDPVLGKMKEVSSDSLSFEISRLLAGPSNHSSPPSLEPVS